ncbi:hypothetical protein DXG03_001020 [Asterophora parasitica]|uniref:Uncharacterized protein n=1 Tax=Asterophora parasitica TaxID=117018 RepID=A0A9P7G9Z9_9AGAR|nr:hypothetical protein DXG03_001020 [Asterophora parasitica]
MVEGEAEEVTDVQRERIAHITEGRAKFAAVSKSQWDVPESLDQSLVDASMRNIGLSVIHRTGFVQINDDAEWVQPSLASNVSAFMASIQQDPLKTLDYESRPPLAFREDANHGFVWRGNEGLQKALRGEAGNEEWTKRCMYVSNLKMALQSWYYSLF